MRGLSITARPVAPLQEGSFILNLPDNTATSAAARLHNARLKQWHQQGEALLTLENARSFLNAAGLVLFAPRPQIAAPAPSFVEAVLGASSPAPTLAEIAQARELLAHLVAEGLAVPLNLLGLGSVVGDASDAPDFIASSQIFSYIFTLRGDKDWKQPPQPTGPGKFSNLAIATHEALIRRGPLSAYDLVTELGKEVTEGAVLRSLGELWSHLRVLPLPQLDGRPTLWELAGTRLTKQIKAGANAGQPKALSALISLYLGQAIVASEDEVESFLSPLAARSRVRDVVHALVAARQLDTVAIEGKTMLHVGGAAPAFLTEELQAVPDVAEEGDLLDEVAAEETGSPEITEHGEIEPAEPGSRIAKFVPRRKPAGSDLAKAKPAKSARSLYLEKRKPSGEARKPFGEPRQPFGEKKPFAPRGDKARPSFGDSKSSRPFAERRSFKRTDKSGEERRPRFQKEGRPSFEKKRFPPRDAEAKPRFERRDREGARPDRERRPFVREDRGGERPPRRFSGADSGGREPHKSFDRPATRRDDGGTRPPRRQFGSEMERPARKPFGKPKREFASGEDRPKRDFKPRSFEGRKPFGGPKKSFDRPKPFGRRAESGGNSEEKGTSRSFGAKRPFAKSGGGFGKKPGGFGRPFRDKEQGGEHGERPSRGGPSFGGKKFGSSSARGPRFGAKPAARGFGAKPGGAKFGGAKFGPKKFGAKKPFSKPSGPRGPRPSRPQGDPEA